MDIIPGFHGREILHLNGTSAGTFAAKSISMTLFRNLSAR